MPCVERGSEVNKVNKVNLRTRRTVAEDGSQMRKPVLQTPDKLPDPWLLDTEYLLRDLARIRELALRIPANLDAIGPVNSVINAVWDLEGRVRYLLDLH